MRERVSHWLKFMLVWPLDSCFSDSHCEYHRSFRLLKPASSATLRGVEPTEPSGGQRSYFAMIRCVT